MSSGKDLSRFFRHSVIYTVGSMLNRVGAFVLLPLYTRFLTPTEYGTLEVLYAFSAIISGVLSVGLAHATLRFYFDYKEDADRHSVISSNLIASLGISVAGVGVAWLAEPLVGLALGSQPPKWGYALVLLSIVLELSSQICLAYLRAREKSMFFVAVVLGKLVVQCACNTYFVAVLKLGVDGVLAGNCLAVLFGWLVLVGYTVRQCGLRFQWAKVLPLLQYSLPFLYTTIVTVVVANVDRFLIAKLLSLEAMGLYALATRFSKLIGDLVGEPFARAYGAFRYTVMDRPDAATIQAQVVRLLACLLGAISLGLVLFTSDVLRLMSDKAFWPAASLMPLLCLASSISTLNYAFQTGVLVKKTTHELFHVSLIQNGVGVVASVALMFAWGVHGACLAVLINAALGAWLTHRASQKHFAVQYDTKRLAALSLATAAAMGLAQLLPSLPWLASLAVKALLLSGFVVAVFMSPVVAAEERAMLLGRLGALKRRLSGPA